MKRYAFEEGSSDCGCMMILSAHGDYCLVSEVAEKDQQITALERDRNILSDENKCLNETCDEYSAENATLRAEVEMLKGELERLKNPKVIDHGKFSKDAQDRALFYTNKAGELLPDRPKKMVEKVIVSFETYPSPLFGHSILSATVPYPAGTPYKIIVEVEE